MHPITNQSNIWSTCALVDNRPREWARCLLWVKRVGFVMSAVCPVYPQQQTSPDTVGTSHLGQKPISRTATFDPRCRDGLSRRDLSCATQLGRAQLSQAHLLERGRQGRSLRGVRAAGTLHRRDSGGVQITSVV